jgi:hypothetical protein
MKKLEFFLVMALAVFSINAQNFQAIGTSGTQANGMSPDGTYVVGQVGATNTYTFVWTLANGYTTRDAERHNSDGAGTVALSINNSGRIAGNTPFTSFMVNDYDNIPWPLITAGYADNGNADWTMLPLHSATSNPRYGFGSFAYGVSENGNIIVGGRRIANEAERKRATVWDVTDPENINAIYIQPDVIASAGSMAMCVSSNGNIVCGWRCNASSNAKFVALWVKNTGTGDYELQTINGNPGGMFKAVSADGTFAVGTQNISMNKAIIYNIADGMLTDLENTNNESYANAVSNNGIVVGHWGNENASNGTAFIYNATLGMVSLTDFFASNNISIPSGWVFKSVTGISADGSKICGFGNLGSFYAEIPELQGYGIFPVGNVIVESPEYQQIKLTWNVPEGNPNLSGYKVYDGNGNFLQDVTDTNTCTLTSLADGTYTYYVTAIYGTDESEPSSIEKITMGKVAFPFYEEFNYPDHNTERTGAALRAALWDVSANTTAAEESWFVSSAGILPNSVSFVTPHSGEYSEAITSPYLDASGTNNLYLNFNVTIAVGDETPPEQQKMAVELFVNNQWITIDDYEAAGSFWGGFEPRRYDVSQYAGNDNTRVRFRCYGTGSGQDLNWFVDNVELTNELFEHTAPLAVDAYKVDTTVRINWADPNGCVTLRYMQDESAYGSTGNAGVPFIAANMYPAEDLALYEGYQLTSLSFLKILNQGISVAPTFKWFVMQNGVRLYSADVVNPQTGWNTITIDNPITIDNTKPLYYGVEVVTHDAADMPIGRGSYYIVGDDGMRYIDLTIYYGRGDIFSENGGQTWQKLSDFEMESNQNKLFCVKATLAPANAQPKGRILGYRLYRNNESMGTIFGSETSLFRTNNFTDFKPLPEGVDACYKVAAYYLSQVASEYVEDCNIGTNIEQVVLDNQLVVFPNPVENELRISNYELRKGEFVQILDVTGKQISNIQIVEYSNSINVSKLIQGVYFIKIGDKMAKFVKK